MKILKAIGNFFVKIWRWIKNTAWVQPLLIVGAIFGVIFSIPAITSGIQNLINSNNSADTFYKNYKKTLEGAENSPAEVLLNNYRSKKDNESFNLPAEEMKYFLLFTASNNSTASDMKPGFQKLRDSWNDFGITDGNSFRLYTIYTDETTTSTTKTDSAFAQFIGNQSPFLYDVASQGKETEYYLNNTSIASDLGKIESCDASSFPTPTIVLVDWTNLDQKKFPDRKRDISKGIAEVFFSVPGNNSVEKASFLADAWMHRGKFNTSSNS